ncbi:MAG: hypothetical protein KJ607_07190, partial [Bacteroidetes bacterium]|nr:hypothetical protein [Bacteroidota bacterium]
MIVRIRKSRISKVLSVLTLLIFLNQMMAPNVAFALTSGPSQPEVQSFESVSTSEMVDLFSGDFVYNIPLLTVGDYPINISYHSGIGMDQEASWVGLGWNINPGVINRSVRGLPDDFKGDNITKQNSMKPDKTYKLSSGIDLEIIGFGTIGGQTGLYYNNYKGTGLEQEIHLGVGPFSVSTGYNSQMGIDINPSLSISGMLSKNIDQNVLSVRGGIGYNSRTGLKDLTISTSIPVTATNTKGDKKSTYYIRGGGSLISFANPTYPTKVTPNFSTEAYSLTLKIGASFVAIDPSGYVNGIFAKHGIHDKTMDYHGYGFLYEHNA